MAFKEVEAAADIGKVCPLARRDGCAVKVVDKRSLHGQQDGGMGGQDELTAVEAHRIQEELRELLLIFKGQAVFRLIEEV